MINIGIPTRGRPDKLNNCINSIDHEGVKIHIVCHDIDKDVKHAHKEIAMVTESKEMMTIASHNYVTSLYKGSFLGLSDDIVFHPHAIQIAYACLLEHFPDTDGVVYLEVVNMDSVAGAYMLLGDKFIDRFPNRTPYCPAYKFMRASSELRLVANMWGKVVHCKEAKIDHHHPSSGADSDETHNRTRASGIIEEDHQTFARRQSEGKLWGVNEFKLDH